MTILDLTKDNFDETVDQGIALVEFWATWCGPCRMFSPILEEFAEKYADQVKVCKVNADEEEELIARFGVMMLPTVLLFKDGHEIGKRVGVHPVEEFEEMLAQL